MTVHEAYEHGKKMYEEGMDLNNIPSDFSSLEHELCELGYEEAMNASRDLDISDDELDFLDPIYVEDNYKELYFE